MTNDHYLSILSILQHRYCRSESKPKMISPRTPSLLKSFQRWSQLSVARAAPAARNFTSPAVKRFRQKQLGGVSATNDPRDVPHSFEEMDTNTLLTVAALENHEARIEVLKRHIMSVDKCSHAEATEVFKKIATKNREGMAMAALPYQLGILAGAMAALGSMPMVFDLSTTLWFNEYFVTTEVPGKEDLETPLEVGSWAWNWMEPPLGTLSFLLLSLQFSRAQMDNLGIKPYTSTLKKMRGRSLAKSFPRYHPKLIMDFSETDPLMKIGKKVL